MFKYFIYSLFTLTVCSLISCSNKNDFKLSALKLELNKVSALNDSLKEIIPHKDFLIDSIIEEENTNTSQLINSTIGFMKNKPSMFDFTLKYLDLNNNEVMSAFWNSSFIHTTAKFKEYSIKNKKDVLFYVWNNLDRSPESIESFFSDQDKLKIFSLFKNNTIYEDSGLHLTVKSLLLVYEEYILLQNTDQMLVDIYNELNDNEYGSSEIIWEIASNQIKQMFKYPDNDRYYVNRPFSEQRVVYPYSFWARRHKEGNKEVVYELLKELHANVSKENLEIEGDEEEF